MNGFQINNKRVAKNTLLLYTRTLVILAITLYTSRIVLEALGIDDFGIYNVVGGVVAMFSVLSGSLATSISRFITFELGRGDEKKLRLIFCSSMNIQIILSIVIFILGETIGVWFLNSKMNIPPDRLIAANWVLHCSIISFIISLLSVPYNSVIIAHEHMGAFAYVGIVEVVLKLLIVIFLLTYDHDKLILYAILQVGVALIVRGIYGVYCNKKFKECKFIFVYDKKVLKEMAGFASWTFFPNASYMMNTQGINILMNMFFGVVVNAARGIATQVDAAVMQFVNNFCIALNPQITKAYASGEKESMFKLVCQGAKFTWFLMLIFAIPFLWETKLILELWLKEVPDYTVGFVRLSIIASMINMVGNTQWTACQATGRIKGYSFAMTIIGCMVFPISWVLFHAGTSAITPYIVFIFIYLTLDIVRLFFLKKLTGFPIFLFVKEVVLPIIAVTILTMLLPLLFYILFPESISRGIIISATGLLSLILAVLFRGCSVHERMAILDTVKCKLKKRNDSSDI